jgi:Na+/melibiose symporter-like transporter
MTGPVGALLLVCAIAVAWFYLLTRERHARIWQLLDHCRQRQARGALVPQDEYAG